MGRELQIRRKGRFRYGLTLAEPVREDPSIGFDQWVDLITSFSYNGVRYSAPGQAQEEVGADFSGLARGAYKGNGVVFACMLVRMLLFSEARFQFRQVKNGRPGDLFGTEALGPLEQPGPGQTTGDLLAKVIQHADLAGNWFGTNRYGGITTLRPDWMKLVIASERDEAWDPDARVVGYQWQPGGPGSGEDPVFYLPEEIAHFAPIPDPEARFRGMSWLTPIVREVMADKGFTDHKLSFVENGATPNLVVKMPVEDVTKFMPWVEKMRQQHEGASNAYRTLFLGAGMDATAVGTDMQTLDFKAVQGAGETRIAAAAGVPPVIVGLSEGLSSATYSNYGLARRRFADMTMRPLWRNFAASVASLVEVPGGSQLWYDDRDIPALREDMREAAETRQRNAATVASYIINGFDPKSAVDAVLADDMSLLKHTGLVSVQLQEPGAKTGGELPTLPKPGAKASPATGANGSRDDATRALNELVKLAIRNQQPPQVVFEEGAFQARFDTPPPSEVRVDVHIPETEPPVVNLNVPEPAPIDPPVVNVTVEPPPLRSTRKTVEFPDGRVATVTTEEKGE